MRARLRHRDALRAPRHASLAVPEPLAGWVNFASAVATLVSIVASVFVVMNREDAGWYIFLPLAYICLLATAALGLLAYQQIVFDRHRRYVLAIPTLQDALRVVSEATYNVMAGHVDERAFRGSLRSSITLLATAFTQITGTRCRVAIKMVSAVPGAVDRTHLGPDDFAVTTLCRSEPDRGDHGRPEPDLVARNTDFRVIFQGEPYYFNNDLVAAARRFEYEDSHWDADAIKKGRVDYRSAIIWPVTPVDFDETTAVNPPVLGFVCLNSAARDVFSEKFDVALGQSFTHALNLALWTLDRARRDAAVQVAVRPAEAPLTHEPTTGRDAPKTRSSRRRQAPRP